jgi:hypothetical protein
MATLLVKVGKPQTIDADPVHGRRFIPIVGGTVEGGMTGIVRPGGGDWQTIWPDGRMEIAAHYVVEIDGQAVEIVSEGVRQGPPEILRRLAAGEAVDPDDYYFRTAVRFRTAAPALAHLNAKIAITKGARMADHVRLELYELT